MKMIKYFVSNIKVLVVSAILSLILLPINSTMAQTQSVDLSCMDVEFSNEVLSKYPEMNETCMDVIEHKGDNYAKIEGRVVRPGVNRLVLKYRHQDGSWGKHYQTDEIPSDYRVFIDGKSTRIRNLTRGQDINIYVLLGGQYAVSLADIDQDEALDYEPIEIALVEVEIMEELPATASLVPLAGLLGLLFITLGGALTLRRKRKG